MQTISIGSNSWCTLAYADDYMDSLYNRSAWADLSGENRTKLLINSFRWINQQTNLSVSSSDTSDIVKQTQCELAWFIYKFGDTFEQNKALINSGTKSFKDIGYSETFKDNLSFPEFISNMLEDYKINSGGVVIEVTRELEENT